MQQRAQLAEGHAVVEDVRERLAVEELDDRVDLCQCLRGEDALRQLQVDRALDAAGHAAVDLEDGEVVLRLRGDILLRGRLLVIEDRGGLDVHAHECLVHRERTLDCVAAVVVGRGREARADLLVFAGADARRGVVDAVFHRAALDRIPVIVRQELAAAGAVVLDDHAPGGGLLAHGGLRPVDELVEDLRAHGGGVLRVAE